MCNCSKADFVDHNHHVIRHSFYKFFVIVSATENVFSEMSAKGLMIKMKTYIILYQFSARNKARNIKIINTITKYVYRSCKNFQR